MKDHVVGSMSAADLVNRLGSDNWEVAEGGAVPKMFRTDLVATIETYDIIPGTESGDEGTVKIPISSDKQLKWLEASYTDEDGNVKSLGRTELGQNSYSGYVKLPATEAHRNLTVTVKLIVGTTIPINVKNDAVIHNPRLLKADMTPAPLGPPLGG